MTQKHTPGPFQVHEHQDENNNFFYEIVNDEHGSIVFGETTDKELAYKFAAAPELKESGTDLHAALYDLKKAYSDVQKHYGFKPEQSPQIIAAESALKKWVAAIAKAEGK